jgi:hypothetical protein
MVLQRLAEEKWSGNCRMARRSLLSNIRIIRMRPMGTVARITRSIHPAVHRI